jgi:hypothetical protein
MTSYPSMWFLFLYLDHIVLRLLEYMLLLFSICSTSPYLPGYEEHIYSREEISLKTFFKMTLKELDRINQVW